jgi:uncharacterized membrane protein
VTELLAAVTVFVLSHMLPMRASWRTRLEHSLGRRGFLLSYSILSIVVIVWLGFAYIKAPFIQLWPWYNWATWLPVIVMPVACILLVAGITSANPFSLGLGAENYQPGKPGIVSVTRHPVLWALILWAAAHIPANGDAAAIILFGLMLLLSVAGTWTIERNHRNRYTKAEWTGWYVGTSNMPFMNLLTRDGRIDWSGIGWWRLIVGLFIYALLILGHQWLIGVPTPLATRILY